MTTPDNSKREALARWLKANVKRFPTPKVVTLSDFDIDVDDFTGTFKVSLDEQVIDDEFSFEIEGNGSPNLYSPIFHSPLGVPASFPAVQLTTDTENAIESALAHLLPRLRPLGLNKATGEEIDMTTPLVVRVLEPVKLAALRQAAGSRTFRIQIQVESGQIV